jgi:hypothetical protein
MPACRVPHRAPKPLVSLAPLTGSTALGRAASAAAAAAAAAAARSALAWAWAAAAWSASRAFRLTASSPNRWVASISLISTAGAASMPSSWATLTEWLTEDVACAAGSPAENALMLRAPTRAAAR